MKGCGRSAAFFTVRFRHLVRLAWCKRKERWIMNKNFLTIVATAAVTLATGRVTAGTWVNGCYIDGPLCTVCDGMKIVTHAYGTTVCTHCDGTGIEPPEETVIVENTVICDTWGPVVAPPPPPRWHNHCPRTSAHRNPPHPAHRAGCVRPPRRAARNPAPRPAARPAARPVARPAARSTGRRGGGRHR